MNEERFIRNAVLLGEGYLDRIKDKHICIFGLGGVGGNATEALCRMGFEQFTLIDADTVNRSNINRQLIASEDTIGLKKVDAMEARLKSLNPDVIVHKIDRFYLPGQDDIDFSIFDYVIDAIDTVSSKIDIIAKCFKVGVPVISAMGCGNRLDPSKLVAKDLADTSYDPLARIMRQKLRKLGIIHVKVVCSNEEPIKMKIALPVDSASKNHCVPGSSPFVPPAAGLLLAYEVSKDLLKSEIAS